MSTTHQLPDPSADAVLGAVDAPDDRAEVLVWAGQQRAAADAAEAAILVAACAWADMNSVDGVTDAATYIEAWGDSGLTVAGEGAPLVAELSIHEFAACLGLTSEAGKSVIGEALELRHRLPRLWQRIHNGELPAWRGRRVAERTLALSVAAAAYVDRHVAPVAHKVGSPTVDRLVDEATARFMPARAEELAQAAADRRGVRVYDNQSAFDGTLHIDADLSVPDALDFEAAVRAGAAELAALGSTDTLDGRRATAVGEMARRDLTLTFDPAAEPDDAASRVNGRVATRQVVLYVHLAEAALTGTDSANCQVGRWERGGRPLTATQIADWCGQSASQVIVKPVIDLADHVRTDAYEVPDRIRERVALRDGHCVFPYCTRSARPARSDDHGCDCDHITAYAAGGITCTCQLAPLCRRHHRAKTLGRWSYTAVSPASYLWTSPHGHHFVVDHTGTMPHRPSRGHPGHAPPPEPEPPPPR